MEVWKFIGEYENIIRWSVIGLVWFVGGLVVFVNIKRLNRRRKQDENLLQSVTSLNRGTRSERHLVLQLLKNGVPVQTIFHDLYIEKNNGQFSQIDIVMATTEGIIVLEVKEFSGWIFGNGKHSHWTQVLAYGKRKYKFYNPIKQNQGHINTLQKQLKQFENIPFFSIIVFYGDCELKEINFVPKGTYLVKFTRVFEVLKLIKENNKPAPYYNKREIVEILKQAVLKGESVSVQKNHIDNISDMLGKNRVFN